MSTILPATVNITRHEGDYADVVVILPALIPVTDITNVKLEVKDYFNNSLIMHDQENTEIVLNTEKNSIEIPLQLKNGKLTTKGCDGEHQYELEVMYKNKVQTLIRGKIRIEKEIVI